MTNRQPNEDNIMKFAIHSTGYTHIVGGISEPRTITSHPNEGHRIPKSMAKAVREGISEVYPDLAEKPFQTTRLCW